MKKILLTFFLIPLSTIFFFFSPVDASQSQLVCPNITRVQRVGYYDTTSYKEVSQMQKFIIDYFSLTSTQLVATGYYGTFTANFVKKFQQENGLAVTGDVDAATASKMNSYCGKASGSQAVNQNAVLDPNANVQLPSLTNTGTTYVNSGDTTTSNSGLPFPFPTGVEIQGDMKITGKELKTIPIPGGASGAPVVIQKFTGSFGYLVTPTTIFGTVAGIEGGYEGRVIYIANNTKKTIMLFADYPTQGLPDANKLRSAASAVGEGVTVSFYPASIMQFVYSNSRWNILGAQKFDDPNVSSDKNLKTNILYIKNISEKFREVNPITFNWNDLGKSVGDSSTTTQYSVVAQELQKTFPELVSTSTFNYLQINFKGLTVYTMAAVKEILNTLASFKNEFHSKKICVDDENGNSTCITKQQLDKLLLKD